MKKIRACLLINGTQLIGEVTNSGNIIRPTWTFHDPFSFCLTQIRGKKAAKLDMVSFIPLAETGAPANKIELRPDRIMCWFPDISQTIHDAYCEASGRKVVLESGMLPSEIDRLKTKDLN